MPTLRPTFSESWYRVADLRVRLRPSAQISRQYYRGERWYVVRDPAGNQYHRLSAPAYRFVGLLDGTRTVAEAWDLVGGQLADDAPTQNEVIQILSQLHSANLIESNVTPDAAVLLRRHKKMVQRQWQGRLMNILFPRIPLWDPDRFLKRWMPVMRIFLSPFGALLWLTVVILAIVKLVPEWTLLKQASETALSPEHWPFLWASFVLIKAIHELGHGFTCRRYGGEVHDLGVMFLVLVPAPYVDASTAWGFPNKWHRVLVGAGGMIFELFVAAIMAFIWLGTRQGTLINGLAYNVMLVASVSTVIFNANPLLRYDGYYMLSDLLEIPNLRYRSTEYSMGLIKRHLFRVKLPQPLPPIMQRFWLLLYAITSSIYRTFVGIMIIFMVWERVPVLGVLMALGGVVTWLAVPIFKTSKYLLIEPELHRKRGRATAWVLGFVAAVVIVVGFIPFPVRYRTTGVVEPGHKITFAPDQVAGLAEKILAKDGEWVEKGQPIVILRNTDLEMQLRQLEASLGELHAKLDKAEGEDPNAAEQIRKEIGAVQLMLANTRQSIDRLTIRAPMTGQLIAPQLKDWHNRWIQNGEQVGMIGTFDKIEILAMFDQDDAALPYIQAGKEADIRLAGLLGKNDLKATVEERAPMYTWNLPSPVFSPQAGGDAQMDTSDQQGMKMLRPQIQLWLTMDNPGDQYVVGQRAYLRFTLDRKPLIWNWSRRLWQLIQSHSNSKWI